MSSPFHSYHTSTFIYQYHFCCCCCFDASDSLQCNRTHLNEFLIIYIACSTHEIQVLDSLVSLAVWCAYSTVQWCLAFERRHYSEYLFNSRFDILRFSFLFSPFYSSHQYEHIVSLFFFLFNFSLRLNVCLWKMSCFSLTGTHNEYNWCVPKVALYEYIFCCRCRASLECMRPSVSQSVSWTAAFKRIHIPMLNVVVTPINVHFAARPCSCQNF